MQHFINPHIKPLSDQQKVLPFPKQTPSKHPADYMQMWYVLSKIKRPGDLPAETLVERFNRDLPAGEEPARLFAPKMVIMETADGKVVTREKPLTFHYIFLRASQEQLRRITAQQCNNLRPLLNRSSEQRYAMLDDITLENFKIIARAYENTLPFYDIENVDLQAGDLVEVIDGPFAGLQGTFIPRNKSKNGSIMLGATEKLGVGTFDVQAKHIRILRFAEDSKRPYDQIDAIVPKIYAALRKYHADESLTPREITALSVFARRMAVVRLDNHKLEAKLLILLKAANHILRDAEAYRAAAERYEKRRKALTNPWTIALGEMLEAILARDPARIPAIEAKLKDSQENKSEQKPEKERQQENKSEQKQGQSKLSRQQAKLLEELSYYKTPQPQSSPTPAGGG